MFKKILCFIFGHKYQSKLVEKEKEFFKGFKGISFHIEGPSCKRCDKLCSNEELNNDYSKFLKKQQYS